MPCPLYDISILYQCDSNVTPVSAQMLESYFNSILVRFKLQSCPCSIVLFIISILYQCDSNDNNQCAQYHLQEVFQFYISAIQTRLLKYAFCESRIISILYQCDSNPILRKHLSSHINFNSILVRFKLFQFKQPLLQVFHFNSILVRFKPSIPPVQNFLLKFQFYISAIQTGRLVTACSPLHISILYQCDSNVCKAVSHLLSTISILYQCDSNAACRLLLLLSSDFNSILVRFKLHVAIHYYI